MTFLLDHAEYELEGHFRDIKIIQYGDTLEVTDPKALIDYIMSTNARTYLTGGDLPRFIDYINARVSIASPFHVTTQSGLIVAK